MIKEVTGDILKSKAEAIAHGIAPMDNFHQGLALSLREQWPAMYKDFRHYCQSKHPEQGELWVWQGVGGAKIISLFTQEPAKNKGDNPGRASLDAVNHCLKALKKEVESSGIKSLALTKLATGVGGLPWTEVQPLIGHHLAGLKIPIYVYSKYQAGVAANE